MQVELAEQRVKEHAELAVSLEDIRRELMTLERPSSMLDSDSLIDLTDDLEDVSGTAPTPGHQALSLHLPACLMAAKVQACIKHSLSPSVLLVPFALPLHSCTAVHWVLKLLSLQAVIIMRCEHQSVHASMYSFASLTTHA